MVSGCRPRVAALIRIAALEGEEVAFGSLVVVLMLLDEGGGEGIVRGRLASIGLFTPSLLAPARLLSKDEVISNLSGCRLGIVPYLSTIPTTSSKVLDRKDTG
jgi:hypothetical protein